MIFMIRSELLWCRKNLEALASKTQDLLTEPSFPPASYRFICAHAGRRLKGSAYRTPLVGCWGIAGTHDDC